MSENISSFKKISLLVGIISVSIGLYTIFFPQTEIEKCESQMRKGNRKVQQGNYWDAKAHYKNAIACEETAFEAGQKMEECNVKAKRACDEALNKADIALQSNDFDKAKYNYNIALNCDHTIALARIGIRHSKQRNTASYKPPQEPNKSPKRYQPSNPQSIENLEKKIYRPKQRNTASYKPPQEPNKSPKRYQPSNPQSIENLEKKIYRPSDSQNNSPIQDIINNMVTVQGGTFTMGCTKEQSNCDDDETPTHQVTLSTYQISKYEVTQAQWEAVMGNNPSHFKDCPKCPVESVSWDDVQKFIKKLNEKTGKSFRLPTEAEWEYAAREGTANNSYLYSGSSTINDVAWFNDNSGSKTHEVGTKSDNDLGLYDMSGNVWEWCSDGKRTYTSAAVTNPKGSGSLRVLRGGSWNNFARRCRIANRGSSNPDDRGSDYGFRLAHSQ